MQIIHFLVEAARIGLPDQIIKILVDKLLPYLRYNLLICHYNVRFIRRLRHGFECFKAFSLQTGAQKIDASYKVSCMLADDFVRS